MMLMLSYMLKEGVICQNNDLFLEPKYIIYKYTYILQPRGSKLKNVFDAEKRQ